MRYKVVEGSQSSHCCFDYTVVDTHRPALMRGAHYDNRFTAVCECFGQEEADVICDALNVAALEMKWSDDGELVKPLST